MKTSEKALALCHAIEAAGASEQLTKASVLAAELRADVLRWERIADKMRVNAAEWYPLINEEGQKEFARVVLEAYADEIEYGMEVGLENDSAALGKEGGK